MNYRLGFILIIIFCLNFGFTKIIYNCQEINVATTYDTYLGNAKITDLGENYIDINNFTIKIDSGIFGKNPKLIIKDKTKTIYECKLPGNPKNYVKSFHAQIYNLEFTIKVNYSQSYFSNSGSWWLYVKNNNNYAKNTLSDFKCNTIFGNLCFEEINTTDDFYYEGDLDEPFSALDEPLNPFLTASSNRLNSYLAKYLIPNDRTKNFQNSIEVNTTYLNNKNLIKEKREFFGFVVLHDGGDIPGCNKKYPENSDDCVVRNIVNGMWKKNELSSHYYIGCSGEIFKLVSEEFSAQHAGCKIEPYCKLKGINNISIGIDLRNCKRYTENNVPYTKEQHVALNILLQDIASRKLLIETNDETVIGHFEILTYKNDPLSGFNWKYIIGLKEDHRELKNNKIKTPFQLALEKTIDDSSLA